MRNGLTGWMMGTRQESTPMNNLETIGKRTLQGRCCDNWGAALPSHGTGRERAATGRTERLSLTPSPFFQKTSADLFLKLLYTLLLIPLKEKHGKSST